MKGSNIADLEILPETVLSENQLVFKQQDIPPVNREGAVSAVLCDNVHITPSRTSSGHNLASQTTNSMVAETSPQPLVDPAIISLKRPPTTESQTSELRVLVDHSPVRQHVIVGNQQLGSLQLLDDRIANNPPHATLSASSKPAVPITTKPKLVTTGISAKKNIDSLATATLSEPFDDLILTAASENVKGQGTVELGVPQCKQGSIQSLDILVASAENVIRQTGKKFRHRKSKAIPVKNGPLSLEVEGSSPTVTRILQRQTPNPKCHQQSFAEGTMGEVGGSLKNGLIPVSIQGQGTPRSGKQSRRERLRASEVTYGWATEDATDIQEMGEFDFEANLSKFDKRQIFNQFRHDDTTADEVRLISHNRLPPKPGTAGGKNLHFTENVLDSPKINGHAKWNSEAGESEGDLSDDARASSGRSVRRSGSRATLRKPPSRKGNALTTGDKIRTSTASLSAIRYPSLDIVGSPKPKQTLSTSPYAGSITSFKPSLRIHPSNKLCPCLSPLQMLEFEQFATSDLGMTEEMITENAGRGIAETAIRCLRNLNNDSNGENTGNPLIAITAGNHKSGARAIAGARHLRNHGFRVTACILGGEHEDELLDSVRQQVLIYRKSGGTLLTPAALLDGLKSFQICPHLIIDALLGYHTCFEDLRRDQQATYFELVLWAERNKIDVLSIDVPSGLDASNGRNASLLYCAELLVITISEFILRPY